MGIFWLKIYIYMYRFRTLRITGICSLTSTRRSLQLEQVWWIPVLYTRCMHSWVDVSLICLVLAATRTDGAKDTVHSQKIQLGFKMILVPFRCNLATDNLNVNDKKCHFKINRKRCFSPSGKFVNLVRFFPWTSHFCSHLEQHKATSVHRRRLYHRRQAIYHNHKADKLLCLAT